MIVRQSRNFHALTYKKLTETDFQCKIPVTMAVAVHTYTVHTVNLLLPSTCSPTESPRPRLA